MNNYFKKTTGLIKKNFYLNFLLNNFFEKNKEEVVFTDETNYLENAYRYWLKAVSVDIEDEKSAQDFRFYTTMALTDWISEIRSLNVNHIAGGNKKRINCQNFYTKVQSDFGLWLRQDAKALILIEGNKKVPEDDVGKKNIFFEYNKFLKIFDQCFFEYEKKSETLNIKSPFRLPNAYLLDSLTLLYQKRNINYYFFNEATPYKTSSNEYYFMFDHIGPKVRSFICTPEKPREEMFSDFSQNLAKAIQEQRGKSFNYNFDVVQFYENKKLKSVVVEENSKKEFSESFKQNKKALRF